jgi:hypothetical protein
MAATYYKVLSSIPSLERSAEITAIVQGDQINIKDDILGRPARGFKIIPDDSTDSITYRLNNRIEIVKKGPFHGTVKSGAFESTEVWQTGYGVPQYTETGAAVYESVEGLQISSIEFPTIVFGAGGVAITMIVW